MLIINAIIAVCFLLILIILIIKIRRKNELIYDIENDYQSRLSILSRENNTKIKNLTKNYQSRIDTLSRNSNIKIDSLKQEVNNTVRLLNDEKKKTQELQEKISSTKCILCASPSNGKHYCWQCYSKYKDRSIDVRINKCSTINVLDYYGNKSFVCVDTTVVRSRAEARICDFLYNNKIRYIYEKPIYYNENGVTKVLHPDFYLPDYDLYIEYNELNSDSYSQSKDYAMQIYRKKNLNVIIMTSNDLMDISKFLIPKLNSIANNKSL